MHIHIAYSNPQDPVDQRMNQAVSWIFETALMFAVLAVAADCLQNPRVQPFLERLGALGLLTLCVYCLIRLAARPQTGMQDVTLGEF